MYELEIAYLVIKKLLIYHAPTFISAIVGILVGTYIARNCD